MKQKSDVRYAHATPENCAYLAGIFDGEGSVSIREHRTKAGAISHSLRISISSTSIDWLFDLRKLWGSVGSFTACHVSETIAYKGKRKPKACWEVSGSAAKALLSYMFPYLGIKRERALIALNFKIVGPGGRRTPQERAETMAARKKLQLLNQRGVPPISAAIH